MMKYFVTILTAVILVSCAHTNKHRPEGNRVIEEAVLWKAKIDERWVSLDLLKFLEGNPEFTESGNFYTVKGTHQAFGHQVKYLGIMGFGETRGPNVTLLGKVKDVAASIEKLYGFKLKTKNNGESFYYELKEQYILIIAPYPNKTDETVVIGAYTGL